VTTINPEELLLAYRLGIFPMAESRTAEEVLWVRPHERGILPLETFHVPRRLARAVRTDRYDVTVDKAFDQVIRGCAESQPDRRETSIGEGMPTALKPGIGDSSSADFTVYRWAPRFLPKANSRA
jgi:leucyl/phenylalanyl-tRNA--protein transferase